MVPSTPRRLAALLMVGLLAAVPGLASGPLEPSPPPSPKLPIYDGACGSAANVLTYAFPPLSTQCSSGLAAFNATYADRFAWICMGSINGGEPAPCQAPRGYQVTASHGSDGSIMPDSVLVRYGQAQPFAVTPAPDYVAIISGCDGSLGLDLYTTGPILADCAIYATFIKAGSDIPAILILLFD